MLKINKNFDIDVNNEEHDADNQSSDRERRKMKIGKSLVKIPLVLANHGELLIM